MIVPAKLKQWMYRGGHPNWLATLLNRFSAVLHTLGIAPNYLVTLEVRGQRSGRINSLPLVMIVAGGKRYLVSMLGANADWVRNMEAVGGHVTLRHGRREHARLEEVPVPERAPLLKLYLKRAPGARPHFPVSKDAPLSEFERIASQFPVFRVVADESAVNHTGTSNPTWKITA
jgi:F420H(2)-dependent quinone reductase